MEFHKYLNNKRKQREGDVTNITNQINTYNQFIVASEDIIRQFHTSKVSQGTNTENNINSDQKHNTTEENTHQNSD